MHQATETAQTNQADYDPHRDIILTTNNKVKNRHSLSHGDDAFDLASGFKVPIHYASPPSIGEPDPPMMNIVAKYGSNALEPQVVVTAHAVSSIPGTTNSNSVLRLTVRMPMVAIVDEDASNLFVQQLVSVLTVSILDRSILSQFVIIRPLDQINVDDEGTMSLRAKSDRTCKPSKK